MSVRVLVIGDPHFKVSNALESSQMVEEVLKLIKEENIDMVVNLGDTLDTHEKINMQAHRRACEFIVDISKLVPIFVLIGNHDRVNNSAFMTKDHPFTGLNELENVNIIEKTLVGDIKGRKMIFVPYVANGKFQKALDMIPDKNDIIFAHQEFKGCKMGHIESKNGDEWSEDGCMIYSGHIHDYQRIGENIVYVGTPFQHGFSDNEDKAVMILEVSEKEVKEKRVRLDVTRKRMLKMGIDEFSEYEPPANYIVKIVLTGDGDVIRKYIQSPDVKKKINDWDGKVLIKIKNTKHSKDVKITERVSFTEKLNSELRKENVYEYFLEKIGKI